MTLLPDQIAQYHRDGYLVVENLLSDDEVTAFTAHVDDKNTKRIPGLRAHTVDPQYKSVAHHPKITAIVRQLISGQPRIVQTMLLDKPPKIGKGIALHQDTHYLPNEPNTLMACWIALTDTDAGNGGLCVMPQSHQRGLVSTHDNAPGKDHVDWVEHHTMRDKNGKEWKVAMHSFEIDDIDHDKLVRLTVPRGGGVFFTGLTIHGSFANDDPSRPRRAFATHYVKDGTWVLRTDVQETIATST